MLDGRYYLFCLHSSCVWLVAAAFVMLVLLLTLTLPFTATVFVFQSLLLYDSKSAGIVVGFMFFVVRLLCYVVRGFFDCHPCYCHYPTIQPAIQPCICWNIHLTLRWRQCCWYQKEWRSWWLCIVRIFSEKNKKTKKNLQKERRT